MPKKHQKTKKLEQTETGNYSRLEYAFIGTSCSRIKKISSEIIKILSKKYSLAYLEKEPFQKSGFDKNSLLFSGASFEFYAKQNFNTFNTSTPLKPYQNHPVFNEMAMVLVNGNHLDAKYQIVVFNPKKKENILKRLKKLSDVKLILLEKGADKLPQFLKEHLGDISKIPVFKTDEIEKIAAFFERKIIESIPPLYGLVLAGGKSQRMGKDKGEINYHGKSQREYLAGLLDKFTKKTFISCRKEQMETIKTKYSLLPDTFVGLGSFGAILSAFRNNPNAAWLVVAVDLPLVDENALKFLIKNRDPFKSATTFLNAKSQLPEPLISIWEPQSYHQLLHLLYLGNPRPVRALLNADVIMLNPPNPEILKNVNTKKEFEEVKTIISSAQRK